MSWDEGSLATATMFYCFYLIVGSLAMWRSLDSSSCFRRWSFFRCSRLSLMARCLSSYVSTGLKYSYFGPGLTSSVPSTISRFLAYSLSSFCMKFGSLLYYCNSYSASIVSSACSSFYVAAARTSFSCLLRDEAFKGFYAGVILVVVYISNELAFNRPPPYLLLIYAASSSTWKHDLMRSLTYF